MTLRRSMAARQAGPQKPPKAAPPIPETREPGHPRSRHSPHDCPGAHATIERHTRRAARRVRSSPPASRAENDPQRDSPRTQQPATTTTPPETQQRPYTILRSTGRAQYSLRDPSHSGRPQLSEPLVGLRPPAGWGPAAQHHTLATSKSQSKIYYRAVSHDISLA